ncbi:MAG: hypothetical protein ACLQGV_05765 [Bryobacteraceae bacterium]
MEASHAVNAPFRFRFLFVAALLAAIPMAILIFYIDARAANAELASATYSHGVFHAAIAHRTPRAPSNRGSTNTTTPM